MIYKYFENCFSSVRRCTNNRISYLMRNYLIPKDKADDPEEDFVTLDLQIIQRATIVKAANVHDVNL